MTLTVQDWKIVMKHSRIRNPRRRYKRFSNMAREIYRRHNCVYHGSQHEMLSMAFDFVGMHLKTQRPIVATVSDREFWENKFSIAAVRAVIDIRVRMRIMEAERYPDV